MNIIEMAKVAKPGEYWTTEQRPAEDAIALITEEGVWSPALHEPFDFTLEELQCATWHRCTKDGSPLEEA